MKVKIGTKLTVVNKSDAIKTRFMEPTFSPSMEEFCGKAVVVIVGPKKVNGVTVVQIDRAPGYLFRLGWFRETKDLDLEINTPPIEFEGCILYPDGSIERGCTTLRKKEVVGLIKAYTSYSEKVLKNKKKKKKSKK